MENNPLVRLRSRISSMLNTATARIHPFTIFVSCLGILLAYLTGIYASGSIHSASRWMGAMLACTSVITVLQMPSYKESLRPSIMRVVGTLLGYFAVSLATAILPFALAFAGGTMLYVISDEMIPETHHGDTPGVTYALLFGFCLMLVSDVLLG